MLASTDDKESTDVSDENKTNTTSANPPTADQKDTTAGSKVEKETTTTDRKSEASATNKTNSTAADDADAPVIDFMLSNYWNSTYFLAQSNPKIKFVKGANCESDSIVSVCILFEVSLCSSASLRKQIRRRPRIVRRPPL